MARLSCQSDLILGVLVVLFGGTTTLAKPPSDTTFEALVDRYCGACHNSIDEEGDLELESFLAQDVAANGNAWEKVVRKIAARQMPPLDQERPSDAEYAALTDDLVTRLDAAAVKRPRPGRVGTFRRLNRTEYQNAVRDLLGAEINAAELLPADESSHGFDHITVGDLPPSLLTIRVDPK